MKTPKRLLLSLLSAAALSLPTLQAQNEITVHDERFGQDEVFTLPEGMVISEDSLLGDWQESYYLYPDTTCENPNYNPTYAPDVYRERLLRLPTVIDMTYNDIVQRFIDQYTSHGRRGVANMLGKSNLYIPIFEEALDYYGLPLELKYLPVIESAMNPNAVSPAGAAGLWQFMVATGKQYNLQINSRVDERRDPIKSTWAAARLLRDLFRIYGDWHLVLAAYNCGPGNVNKAIHRADEQRDYWKIYPYLPKETRGYVPAFIAANYVMNYYCDHNICPMRTRYPMATDTLVLTRNVDIRQVAERCGVDLDVVKALNPQYRTNIIPGYASPSILRLPQEAVGSFIALKDTIYLDNGTGGVTYAMQDNGTQELQQNSAYHANGEKQVTPAAQAVRNVEPATPSRTPSYTPTPRNQKITATGGRNARQQQQAAQNGRGKGKNHQQQANARNAKGKATAQNNRNQKNGKAAAKGKGKGKQAPKETTIQNGQTLSQIARKHGTTVAELRRLNNLKGDNIRAGRKLRVK